MEYLWKNAESDSREENCAGALFRSFGEAAIQTPIAGVTQLANRLIDPLTGREDSIPELRLIEPAYKCESGTTEWYFQQAGYGLGYAADLAILARVTKGRVPASGFKSAGTLSMRGRAAVSNFVLGASYEGIFRPVHEDEADQFWFARLRNATTGGATMATLMSSRGAVNALNLQSTLPRLSAGALSTVPASIVNAEVHSVLSNGDFATWDELNRAVTPNLVTGLILPKRAFLLPPSEKTGLNLNRERENFKSLAEQVGMADTADNMSTFETRARTAGLSRQEIARTYVNLRKLADPERSGALNPDQKKEVATQALFQAGHPTSIDQGANNTCNVTTSEGWLYTRSPSDPIRMLSKIAYRGRFQTHDGTQISLSDIQLQPDADATKLYPAIHGSGSRSYASQLFQFGAVNAFWQRQTTRPDGKEVARGSLRYDKLPPEGGNPFIGSAQEALIDTSKNPPQRVALSDGTINSPHLGLNEMLSIERQLTGRMTMSRMLSTVHSSSYAIDRASTQEQLGEQLHRLKNENRFPVTINVYASQEPLAKGPVACHHLSSMGGCHVLQIVDYDEANNKVYVDGSWGNQQDFSGKPNEQPPLTREQLFRLMQDGTARTKHLHLSGQKDFKDDALLVVSRLKELESADLSNTNTSNNGFSNFKDLSSIKTLNLNGSQVDDGCNETLATLVNLETLQLSNTGIGDRTIEAISPLKKLSFVAIAGTNVTEQGIVNLAQRGVKHITITAGVLSPERISELQSTHQCAIGLAPPEINSLDFKEDDLKIVKNLPYLESLDLSGTDLTNAGLTQIKALTHLKNLDLNGTKIDDGCLDAIGSFTGLTSLGISGTAVTDKIFDKAEHLESLQSLNLLGTQVTADGLSRFTPPQHLKIICVDADTVSTGFLQRMNDLKISVYMTPRNQRTSQIQFHHSLVHRPPGILMPTVQSVDELSILDRIAEFPKSLTLNFLTQDASKLQLTKLKNVESLTISNYRFDDAHPSNFHQMENLQSLNISSPEIGKKLLTDLTHCKKLTGLTFSTTVLTSEQVISLNNIEQLKRLSLICCLVDDAPIRQLKLPQLESIDLTGCGLTDPSVTALAQNMPGLKILDLTANNRITDAAVDSILKLKSLTSISLAGTRISQEGLTKLKSRPDIKINSEPGNLVLYGIWQPPSPTK
ncbi:MAG: hypothetical protein K2Z81_26680 [Cyanobacteria bacterium]|nr:hypothetical protein [Cyanobacteriota bacterium]